MVYANHTRRRVLEICDKDLTDLLQRESRETTRPEEDEVMRKQRAYNNEQKFWIYANKAEAHFALGEFKQSKKAEEAARAIDHKPWMIESYEEQKSKLRVLLERNGYLLNPPWMAGS